MAAFGVLDDFGALAAFGVAVDVAVLLCGKVLPVPGMGFLMILGRDANPSGMFSARDFRVTRVFPQK